MNALNGCSVEWCGYEGYHTHSGGTKYPLLTWVQRKVVHSQIIEALSRIPKTTKD